MPLSLQVSINEAMTAQCSPPPSEPAKSAFFRFKAMGRMLRSTTLESISMAVVEEASETNPARQRLTDCLGEFGLLTDQSELGAQPGLKVINDRPAPVLAHSPALVGAAATDFLFNCIETGDALERFAGDRRGTRRGELVEAAANVGPQKASWTLPRSASTRYPP